jgi:hypothetical protein
MMKIEELTYIRKHHTGYIIEDSSVCEAIYKKLTSIANIKRGLSGNRFNLRLNPTLTLNLDTTITASYWLYKYNNNIRIRFALQDKKTSSSVWLIFYKDEHKLKVKCIEGDTKYFIEKIQPILKQILMEIA